MLLVDLPAEGFGLGALVVQAPADLLGFAVGFLALFFKLLPRLDLVEVLLSEAVEFRPMGCQVLANPLPLGHGLFKGQDLPAKPFQLGVGSSQFLLPGRGGRRRWMRHLGWEQKRWGRFRTHLVAVEKDRIPAAAIVVVPVAAAQVQAVPALPVVEEAGEGAMDPSLLHLVVRGTSMKQREAPARNSDQCGCT